MHCAQEDYSSGVYEQEKARRLGLNQIIPLSPQDPVYVPDQAGRIAAMTTVEA